MIPKPVDPRSSVWNQSGGGLPPPLPPPLDPSATLRAKTSGFSHKTSNLNHLFRPSLQKPPTAPPVSLNFGFIWEALVLWVRPLGSRVRASKSRSQTQGQIFGTFDVKRRGLVMASLSGAAARTLGLASWILGQSSLFWQESSNSWS